MIRRNPDFADKAKLWCVKEGIASKFSDDTYIGCYYISSRGVSSIREKERVLKYHEVMRELNFQSIFIVAKPKY